MQSLPLRRQPFLAANRQAAYSRCGRGLDDVDLRRRQSPRTALNIGGTRERCKRGLAIADRELVHGTIERNQYAVEQGIETWERR